jgi:signal transduction histidine kinase
VKLRTKFLSLLCGILLLFGFATVCVVNRVCEIQIRRALVGDLRNSVLTFRRFESVSDQRLAAISELIASMPALKALMTTQDKRTIQDGSTSLWRITGSDLFVLSDPNGVVMAVHSTTGSVVIPPRQVFRSSLQEPGCCGWSLLGGRVFEIVSEPIYFGPSANSHLLGIVTIGYQITDQVTKTVADISASQVAFQYGDFIVSTTLTPTQLANLPKSALVAAQQRPGLPEIKIAGERFLVTTVTLSDSPKPVRLLVLKSFDQASLFLRRVNELVVAMNVVAIVAGCVLVVLISRRFTKPLDELLEGVRALEQRNFTYPLSDSGNGEFAELKRSFIRMRSSLSAAEQKLLEAESAATIGRMASSLSHDLRHRLTAIIANAEFLAESGLSAKRRRELYENVLVAVKKMTDLLESLLEFSRTPQSLRREYLSVEEIVEDSIAAVRLHPQFQHLRIAIEAVEPVSGWFDPKTLERGLYNLLLNACEAISPALGLIKVEIQRIGSRVAIRVSDNGPGIADSIREKLFLPFVSHGKQHGSGLGLAIVQKACQDHGGKLSVEHSSPGATTFLMILPLGAPPMIGAPDAVFLSQFGYGVPDGA